MKYSLLYFLVFVLFCSCKNNKSKERSSAGISPYIIKGDIKNLSAKKVYLVLMHIDSTGHAFWPNIDSAIVSNDKFLMEGDTILKEPGWSASLFYYDSLTSKKKYFSFDGRNNKNDSIYKTNGSFILENSAIDITGDSKSESGLSLMGSPESEFIYRYGLMTPSTELYDLRDKVDALAAKGDSAKLKPVTQQYDSVKAVYKAWFKKIMAQNPQRFIAMANIYQRATIFAVDEIEEMMKGFDKNLLQLPTAEKIYKIIEQMRKLQTGKLFPDFNYFTTNSETKKLNDVKGTNYTLIVFWASWCNPCRQEIPELKKLHNEYQKKGVSIVSISIDRDINKWKQALAAENMPWANLSNLPGNYNEVMEQYNIKAIPEMYLLDKDNKIISNPRSVDEIRMILK